ncbi:MAG TPA: hypothetical protein PLR06_04490 [Cyclobacteriaceae bacterium]|nr:hypothetical protein [Cyclobacteriaceae bacterium]
MKSFFLLLFLATVHQVFAQTPRSSQTQGTVTIAGKPILYDATVEEIILPMKGEPAGSLIMTSYIAQPGTAERSLIFVFNGGPGASSSPLHMYSFGPVRLKRGQDSTRQINNEHSLLDVADLVFIDPVGTGFTQILNEEKAAAYWDVEGDAQVVIEAIKWWKEKHGRIKSTTFICGESYGTVRAAKMMGIAEDFPVKGVLLFSPVLDYTLRSPVSGNEMPYILQLPSMAAVAWYHHKTGPSIKSGEQAFDEATAFANGDYLNALFQGNQLTQKQLDKVAAKLASLTGLSERTVKDKKLRITTDDFEMLLLADQQERIGKLDGTIKAPVPKEAKPYSARDDPSLKVNVVMERDFVGKYFTKVLKFPGTGLYRGVNFEVNGKWKWTSMDAYLGYYSVLPGLEKAMEANPQIRLLVAGGIYDLATPLYSTRYLLNHSSIPANRTTFLEYPTGHSIFDNETELKKFADAVRKFVKE